MLMVCHHLNPAVPEDLAFAESRIRATTIAAEDHLHDLGAISITSSDAQAMGRIGEVITRTWQVAHVMKQVRGELGGGLPADNFRARRYVAKYTINPAIATVSITRSARSRSASWPTWCCGTRGSSASRPSRGDQGRRHRGRRAGRPERLHPHAAAGADAPDALLRQRRRTVSQSYVAPAALEAGWPTSSDWLGELVAVRPTRSVGKAHMINNDALPDDRDRRGDPRHHRRRHRDHPARRLPGPADRDARRLAQLTITAAVLSRRSGVTRAAVPEPAAGRRPAADRRAHPVGRGRAGASRTGCGWTRCPTTSRVRLRTVTEVEAAAAVVARHRWRTEPDARTRPWREVDRGLAGPDAVRRAAGRLGLCSGAATCGRPAAVWPLRRRCAGHRTASGAGPVVLGATAAEAGLAAGETARLVGFDDVQTVIAAALKLQPFDPAAAWPGRPQAGPEVEALVERVAGLTATDADPGVRRAADRGVGPAAPSSRAAVVPCLTVSGSWPRRPPWLVLLLAGCSEPAARPRPRPSTPGRPVRRVRRSATAELAPAPTPTLASSATPTLDPTGRRPRPAGAPSPASTERRRRTATELSARARTERCPTCRCAGTAGRTPRRGARRRTSSPSGAWCNDYYYENGGRAARPRRSTEADQGPAAERRPQAGRRLADRAGRRPSRTRSGRNFQIAVWRTAGSPRSPRCSPRDARALAAGRGRAGRHRQELADRPALPRARRTS